jgi:hypothetical protein
LRIPNGYNMSDGGEGNAGFKFSRASRLKVSLAGRGKKRSAETCQRISDALKGRVISVKARKKLSKSLKAKWQNDPEYRARMIAWNHSQEHRDRISAANSKRVCLPSTRAKRSEIAKLYGFGLKRRGSHPTAESRQKMSEAALQRAPITEETRRRISAGHVGLHPTLETRKKMSEAAKRRPRDSYKATTGFTGRKHSEESLRKMAQAHLGSHRTEETKQKMREARKLQAPASEATRQRMRESSAARWSRPEEHQKISDKLTGRKLDSHKPETIAKMKAAWAIRKQRLAA